MQQTSTLIAMVLSKPSSEQSPQHNIVGVRSDHILTSSYSLNWNGAFENTAIKMISWPLANKESLRTKVVLQCHYHPLQYSRWGCGNRFDEMAPETAIHVHWLPYPVWLPLTISSDWKVLFISSNCPVDFGKEPKYLWWESTLLIDFT